MTVHFLKNTLRHLFRDKIYSCLNIFGLAIAMVCSIFIFLFVSDELSYDNYHDDADRIYRIVNDFVNEDGNTFSVATTPPALKTIVQKELPEVECAVRLFPTNGRKTLFRFKEKIFYEDRMYHTDNSIFQVFSFPFIKGNPKTALSNPDAVVITESTAKKYFGDNDAIGQTLAVEDQYLGVKELTVTAVLRDIPLNSHFRFDILRPASYMIAPQQIEDSWGFAAFHTYVKLKKGFTSRSINDKLDKLVQRYNPENKNHYYAQPMREIHLHSNLQREIEANGDFKNIIILVTLAAFIIIVAGINYVNLSTARAVNRAKEVGVRKVSGALKSSIVKQFLGESVFTSLIALFVALIIAVALLPSFNQLTGKHYTGTFNNDLFFWVGIVGFALLAGILSGIYPALYLSSFSPVKVLRNNLAKDNSSWSLRSVLVSLQFITSVTLIVCTGVIIGQMNFIQSARLGFEHEQVIVIPDVYQHINYAALRQRLLQHPEVVNVGSSSGMISGNNWHGKMHTRYSKNEIPMTMCYVDTSFLQTLGITMLQSQKMSLSDSLPGIVINETAAKQLGLSSPLGEEIFWPGDSRPSKIVGVVRDFHFESLRERISPFVFQFRNEFLFNVFIRVKSSGTNETLGEIESEWKNVAPDRPFQYFFLDNQIERQYQAEMKFRTFFFLTTIVAMLIACLGLIGLTALVVKNRTKEIGIRKVLGASPFNILRLLTTNLLLIILVSITIALPVAYIAMENWLTNFAYRITLSAHAGIFILPAIVVVCLAIITIGLFSIKTVNTNPVKMLRSE